MKNHRGLILIELITVIVLIGIIASFSGFFLYTGFTGYLNAKNTVEGALNAQMALDRITLELRDINEFNVSPVEDQSLSYKSETLTGTRILKYDSNTDSILIKVNETDHTLLENVLDQSFILRFTYRNLDHDQAGVEEVAQIDVGFKLTNIDREFKTSIFPRHMVKKTW